ncbi:zinc-binding dehydrogenase [Desulfosarcina cetonica]|uniref:zinc-binding dehydrogenase n=1 Tax=Desulfosarcina cetonica TaxID=90730 RepID=UPI001C441091|nr:zinc-binding dehydrogenase [Desulfosarcina cetonica]
MIGLGLLGQLTCLLLRAAGVRVIGIDINPRMIDIAGENCTDLALARDAAGVEARINAFTQGIGCDAVIITAASDSLDPINFAGAISRKRGTVVVVGAVPTGFDREPHYYQKELQVKMSCSYGPGRYDPVYEEKGVDYPQAYVRWTEKRNMQSFQDLLFSAKIDVGYLTTHIFRLEEAPAPMIS